MLQKRINEKVNSLIKLEINCIRTSKWDRKKEAAPYLEVPSIEGMHIFDLMVTTSELRFTY